MSMTERRTEPVGLCFFLLLIAIAPPARSEWLMGGEAAYKYNDNLSLAQQGRDIESGNSLNLRFSPGYHFQATNYTGLTLNADLQADRNFGFTGLSQAAGGVSMDLFHKFGIGREVPWMRAGISTDWHDYANNQRDGWQFTAGISAGKRFSDHWQTTISYQFEAYRADKSVDIPALYILGIEGDAFDTDAHLLSINTVYTVNYRLSLIAGFAKHLGEVTSTTRRSSNIFDASDAITPDPVFGTDRFAYRIDANTNIFSFGISYALTGNVSLNAGYEYRDSNASHGLAYTNNIFSVNAAFRY